MLVSSQTHTISNLDLPVLTYSNVNNVFQQITRTIINSRGIES